MMKKIAALVLTLQLAVICVCSGYAEETFFEEDLSIKEAAGEETVPEGESSIPGESDGLFSDMDGVEDVDSVLVEDVVVEEMTEGPENLPEEEISEEEMTEGFEEENLIESADEEDQLLAAGSYTYTITPLLAPFNNLFYVQTEDPDPASFRFADRNSQLISDTSSEKGICQFLNERYQDVVYKNDASGRVKGGYIFYNYYCDIDGGELVLQRKNDSGDWSDTALTVTCPPVVSKYQYLIDTYTNDSMSFFDKLSAVQSALNNLAVYPRSVRDSSRPGDHPYPLLAVSPYQEMSLNIHYSIYEDSDRDALSFHLYPFVLDSLSFPGTIQRVAKMLDSSCSVEGSSLHYIISISSGGETHSYGGAGTGDSDPVYTDQIAKAFFFDGRSGDLAACADLNNLKQSYLDYGIVADQNIESLKDQVMGDEYARSIGPGTWVRVATEGMGFGTSYGYIAYGPGGRPSIASNCWVDGRYIGLHECLEMNTSFAEHPYASIILRNVSYTDKGGKEHTNDIIYKYDRETDTWRAPFYYVDQNAYSTSMQLPDQFILTREQVEKMQLNGNTSHIPESGKIYDGTAYPGTEFGNVLLQGISLPESITILAGETVNVPVEFTPSDTSETRVNWTSSDESVLMPGWQNNTIYGQKNGQAVLTGVSVDGGFGASCTVTVRQRQIKVKDDKQVTALNSITPGRKISDVYVTNAVFVDVKTEDTVYGSFKYDSPDRVLPEGTHVVSWTFTPYIEAYELMHGTVTITVKKDPYNSWNYGYGFEEGKQAQPMRVTTKTVKVKYKKLKKKKQTIPADKAFSVKGNKGSVTFKKISGDKKIKISKNGKITLKKGLKKKTYKVKVKITAAGNSLYAKGSRTVTLKIRVK